MAIDWITLCHVSPAIFACTISGGRLKYGKHWKLIDKALMRVATGKCRNLIINVPPQFGKSELVSKHFTAWYLSKFPQKKIILVSYESDYAASWGYKSRDVFAQYAGTAFNTGLGVMQARDWWETSEGGYMATGGALASVTGKGADLLIIDDPHKNSNEAHSRKIREKLWDNYLSTYLTRLQPNGSQIIIQTRWHEDDLTGRLLKTEPEKWEKIVLPALNEDCSESLFPERYSVKELLEKKKTMGEYVFNALYQQTPTPKEGGIFKGAWFKYWTRHPNQYDRIIISWDLSEGSEGEGSSYQVGCVLGKTGPNTYLIDMVRGKWDFPTQVKQIRALAQKHPRHTAILIEKKSTGKAACDMLSSEIPRIIKIMPTESKEARASAVSYLVESGNFYLPENDMAIKSAVYTEMTQFPNSDNDDIVDTISQGLNYIYNRQMVVGGHANDI
jgi:predicted phage terminase large subunit-like protein